MLANRLLKKYFLGFSPLAIYGEGPGVRLRIFLLADILQSLKFFGLSPQTPLSILEKGASKVKFYFINRLLSACIIWMLRFARSMTTILMFCITSGSEGALPRIRVSKNIQHPINETSPRR